MCIYTYTILAYLRYSLTYMRQVAIHVMDYVDAAMTNILSPDILLVEDLRSMLQHVESEIPSTMHLPISLDDILNLYWYLNTHVLIAEGQFLLLIDVPIQNRAQQLEIYEVFNLPVLHSNLSAQYKINHRHIVTCDITVHHESTVHSLSACRWTVLPNKFTIPTPHKLTIMYYSPVC